MKWDKENPLHQEIMDAGMEASYAANMEKARRELAAAIARLPWWLRLYAKVYLLITSPFRTRFYAHCVIAYFRLRGRISWIIRRCKMI